MTNREINILKYHIKDILNKYPESLLINVEKNELSVSLNFDYYDAWNKFINESYEWDVVRVDLSKEFNLKYLKRLLQAKNFLKENYKRISL